MDTRVSTRRAADGRGGRVFLVAAAGTLAWAVRFTVSYLLVPTACAEGAWMLHVTTAVTAVVALSSAVLAWRWAGRDEDAAMTFALRLGAALNLFFLGAILLEGSSVILVDACTKAAIP